MRAPVRTVPSGRVTSTTFGCGTGSAAVAATASSAAPTGPDTSAAGTTVAVRGRSVWNDQRENRLFALNVATRTPTPRHRDRLSTTEPKSRPRGRLSPVRPNISRAPREIGRRQGCVVPALRCAHRLHRPFTAVVSGLLDMFASLRSPVGRAVPDRVYRRWLHGFERSGSAGRSRPTSAILAVASGRAQPPAIRPSRVTYGGKGRSTSRPELRRRSCAFRLGRWGTPRTASGDDHDQAGRFQAAGPRPDGQDW
jgi:hypothetical protein